MELGYINAFTRSAYNILKSYLDIESQKGVIEKKSNTSPFKGIAILLGVTGEINGKIIFDMSHATGFRLAERFNQEYINEINDLFISTMKEFGNVICGNAMIELEKININCDITTPTIILGEHMHIAEESDTEIIMIPFVTDIGEIDINVVREKSLHV